MGTKELAKRFLRAAFGRDLGSVSPSMLGRAEVVSFDVFDTLVVRDCSEPGVVFDLVQRRYNSAHPDGPVSGFRAAREGAESEARRLGGRGEPTVFDIYAMLGGPLAGIAHDLLALELDTELKVCRANPDAKALFDRLVAEGRRVVVASDMYLPGEWVGDILARCGYSGYERLYVSCDCGATKREGDLFAAICDDAGIKPSRLLHIGDHPLADWASPMRYGATARLYGRGPRAVQPEARGKRAGIRGRSNGRYGAEGDIPASPDEIAGGRPLVSVIMPVYNSEEYLPGAIDSIMSQDFASFELLLVDDGSTDGSGAICDAAAGRDPRVRAFHKPNGGICSARNYGLDRARGEYVTFSDNDDEYLPHYLKDNFLLLEALGADVIRFGHVQNKVVDGVVRHASERKPAKLEVLQGGEIALRYHYIWECTQGAVWGGMYRRSLIDGARIRFDERMAGGYEDCVFNLAVYSLEPSLVLNPGAYYKWMRRTDHSTSMHLDSRQVASLEQRMLAETDYLRRNGIDGSDPRFYQQCLYSPAMDAVAIAAQRPDAPLGEYSSFLEAAWRTCGASGQRRGGLLDPKLKVLVYLMERRRYRTVRLVSTAAYRIKHLIR